MTDEQLRAAIMDIVTDAWDRSRQIDGAVDEIMDAVALAAQQPSREERMLVLDRNAEGVPTIWCDPEIADIVAALNTHGLKTDASCSGHGHVAGLVSLADGREVLIAKDAAQRDLMMSVFPTDINGTPRQQPSQSDYEAVLADHKRLVRELDVLLNGEAGAAQQASLVDLVAQVRRQGIRAALPSQSAGVVLQGDRDDPPDVSLIADPVLREVVTAYGNGPHYEGLRRVAALVRQSQSAGEPVAWHLERRNTITGEWQVDLQERWEDGQPLAELVRSVGENAENYRFKFAYSSPPPTTVQQGAGVPFVVRHYTEDEGPIIKGNGFDGLRIGNDREEAQAFIDWINSRIASPPHSDAARVEADRRDAEKAWNRFEAATAKGQAEDAARYQFLRNADRSDSSLPYDVLLTLAGYSLDIAIDDALAAERNNGIRPAGGEHE